MTQGFEEFYSKYYNLDGYKHHYEEFYKAGAASRQNEVEQLRNEVEELNFKLAEMKSRLNDAYTDGQTSMYKTKQVEIDELQKRIDDALNKLLYMHRYGNDVSIIDVIEILKGESNG